MPKNAISLIRVSDLFGKRFFVPDYQRGYRWTETQVQDLLSDIYSFARIKEKGDTYCLQPLVVKPFTVVEDDNPNNLIPGEWYEVIDGQQRLTTIKILFAYFVVNGRIKADWLNENEIIIEYATRKATGDYLRELAKDGNENNTNNLTRDMEHIRVAYQTIKKWFDQHSSNADSVIYKIRETMKEPSPYDDETGETERLVRFILFEVDPSTNSIDAFERINIGKISLTNAELIKALFLQKSNFSKENENQLRRQHEIADAWDSIEASLQNDHFWYFLNEEINNKPSRIDFIFEFIYNRETGEDQQQKDDYETFRFFSDKLSKVKSPGGDFGKITSLWNDIRMYYDTFWEWYSDTEMYYYIGFLVYQGKTDLKSIYDYYVAMNKDKFKETLKSLIRDNLNVTYTETEPDETGKRNFRINLSYDSTKKKLLRQFFLLLNIQHMIMVDRGACNRLSFSDFKKEQWDIEHIDSYTENSITKESDQKKWIDVALEALSADDRGKYNMAVGIESLSFDEKKALIIRISGEFDSSDVATSELKNSIGNLTLLDAETNRSYGNALFPTKRKEIIRRDSEGCFVLPCTKAVFLKYFAEDCASLKKWNNNDIEEYTNYIGSILKQFMKKEEEQNV